MYDKFQMIDELIVEVNNLVDARGIDKCKLCIDIIQRLSALRNGLKQDDERREREQDADTSAE